ncbi:MAG: hypothetical protein H6884_02270 [Rhodobiaceae bacterium]|nr:hypothetical protein [Rhodobiaceae bacterium]MCC0052866.1 hypothetical protein [Rhodobiaceae bacterium]
MVEIDGQRACRKGRVLFAGMIACGVLLSGCAGPSTQGLPPLRPAVPNDLRQPTHAAPDFRLPPPPVASTQTKTADEQASAMEELEKLRDTHENATRKTIERR